MEGDAKILWEFLNAAYRAGTIDQIMDLSKAAADKKFDNQARLFEDIEDAASEVEDFSDVDQTLEIAYGRLALLTDEEVIEGLGVLASLLTPLVDSIMESAGRDIEKLNEKRDQLMRDLPKAGKALLAILAANSDAIADAIANRPIRDYGRELGRAVNSTAAFVNRIEEQNPGAISDFMAGAFDAVDKNEFNKMTDTLTQGFLDQKPPLLKYTAATMFKRAKKLVLRK